jgi:hypothetical protein
MAALFISVRDWSAGVLGLGDDVGGGTSRGQGDADQTVPGDDLGELIPIMASSLVLAADVCEVTTVRVFVWCAEDLRS